MAYPSVSGMSIAQNWPATQDNVRYRIQTFYPQQHKEKPASRPSTWVEAGFSLVLSFSLKKKVRHSPMAVVK
jgi:hypothetical protein